MKKLITLIIVASLALTIQAQNITNTLGSNGKFLIKSSDDKTIFTFEKTILGPAFKIGIDRVDLGGINSDLEIQSALVGPFINITSLTDEEHSAIIYLQKARGTGLADVHVGDELGKIHFLGYKGQFHRSSAGIEAVVTDMSQTVPSAQLMFSTKDGAADSDATTRMTIKSDGTVNIANLSGSGTGIVAIDNDGNLSFTSDAGATSINGLSDGKTNAQNVFLGHNAGSDLTTGNYNTATGYDAMNTNTEGNYNTAVGNEAGVIYTNLSYTTAIGSGAKVSASYTIRLGDGSVGDIGGQVGWTTVSDGRFKTNLKENVAGLDFIMKLRPLTYHFDMDALASFNKTPDNLRDAEGEKLQAETVQIGFVAQEVEEAAIELGFDFHGVVKPKNEDSHYGLRYAEFVVPLVKAVQEQQAIIEQLENSNNVLAKSNDDLIKSNDDLQKNYTELLNRVEKLEVNGILSKN